jgi:hypothetical protein
MEATWLVGPRVGGRAGGRAGGSCLWGVAAGGPRCGRCRIRSGGQKKETTGLEEWRGGRMHLAGRGNAPPC